MVAFPEVIYEAAHEYHYKYSILRLNIFVNNPKKIYAKKGKKCVKIGIQWYTMCVFTVQKNGSPLTFKVVIVKWLYIYCHVATCFCSSFCSFLLFVSFLWLDDCSLLCLHFFLSSYVSICICRFLICGWHRLHMCYLNVSTPFKQSFNFKHIIKIIFTLLSHSFES